jgi:hypothetical protein
VIGQAEVIVHGPDQNVFAAKRHLVGNFTLQLWECRVSVALTCVLA